MFLQQAAQLASQLIFCFLEAILAAQTVELVIGGTPVQERAKNAIQRAVLALLLVSLLAVYVMLLVAITLQPHQRVR
jgi:membrane-associated protease RseP (regulator of RpoE activity)